MKIFVLSSYYAYEANTVIGAYSTEALAEAAWEDYQERQVAQWGGRSGGERQVTPCELDEEADD